MSNGESKHEGEHEISGREVRHPETLYDRSDLSARAIVYFLIMLGLTVVVIHLLMWGYLRFASHKQLTPVPRNAAIVPPASQAGAKGDPAQRFPAPRLQPDPVTDLNRFRAAVEEQLNSGATGRVPIEQAMDTVVKNGLPVRPQPALPPRARFASGDGSAAGAGGGTQPKGNQ